MIAILLKITATNAIKRKRDKNKNEKYNNNKSNIVMELMSLSILKFTKLIKMAVQDVTD